MKKNISLILLLLSYFSTYPQNADDPEITSEEIQDHISYLASDGLKGRDSGTEECLEAANYISDEFEKYGLKPLFGNSYLQEFSFIATIELTDKNNLVTLSSGKELKPKLREEYITVPFSGNADITGNLVFAGFGISAPDLNYDDYEGLDVNGKIVVVMRNHPQPDSAHSVFDDYSPLRKKSSVARDKGAIGIIFVNPYDEFNKEDDLIEFEYDRGGAVTGFAVVNVKQSIVEQLFESQGLNFKESYDKIIQTQKTASFEFKNATTMIQTEIKEVEKISWNVGGILEGNNPALKNEYLILGAHFDHLGMGGENSLYKGDPQIHNGADDNASGTTGVLELAEKFVSQKDKIKRSIVFLTFSGEELGLLGSNYFVNNMPFPSEEAACMINMDMIGRLKDSSLIVYGTGTSSNWKEILNKYNNSFKLSFNEEGFGPSDHSSFYGKKIPVLFFFTGTHEDYHKPSDDANKINSEGEESILKYVYDITMDIDQNSTRPDYLLVEKKESGKMFTRKVYVGTIPDFAGNVDGYKISGVSEGSPAQTAGLQGGDIIIKFGVKKISNIYDFTYALADFVPGDIVDVVVKRGEEEMTFKVQLGTK